MTDVPDAPAKNPAPELRTELRNWCEAWKTCLQNVLSENADGTVFGGGAGVVVLKRLEDAVADGDSIYAVIRGFATNNDGSDKVGYTAPSVEGQANVIAMAQALAGVSPDSIGYVEAHGTGTPLGDPIDRKSTRLNSSHLGISYA